MSIRHAFRPALVAAAALLAGAGVAAIEATNWTPQTDAAALNTDGLREPLAWTVQRGDATEFHDAVSRDTVTASAPRDEPDLAHIAAMVGGDDPIGAIAALVTDVPAGSPSSTYALGPASLADSTTVEVR